MKTFKKIVFKLFVPGFKEKHKEYRAPKGKMWSRQGEQSLIQQQFDLLNENFPDVEFNAIPVGDHQYNFVGSRRSKEG